MAKPLVSASYDKSRFLVMHDPDAHPLESLARGKSSVGGNPGGKSRGGNPVSVGGKSSVSSSFLPEKTN